MLRRSICSMCCLALSVVHAEAQLFGEVRDATGLPLAGVAVSVRGPVDRSTLADGEGRFSFRELPEGEYELTAVRAAFAPFATKTRVGSREPSSIMVVMTIAMLEQTTVTASKMGETDPQTLPAAVAVLSGTDLRRMQDRTIEDIAGRAPGVFFTQNTGLAQVTIRGIGTNAVFAGSDPSSAVYLDGVYLARPAMALMDFFDLDRVEVLRGPQGTLYGRNSIGGAINLITRPPTNETELAVRVSGGDQGAVRGEARVSGPLVHGKVLGSTSIVRSLRRGPVNDLEHPDHPLGGEDLFGWRGQLRAIFGARSELHLMGDFTHSDPAPVYYSKILAVKPGFAVDMPQAFYDVRASFPAEGLTRQGGAAARLTVDLTPAMRVTSVTAFRALDFDVIVDGDASELNADISRVHELQHQLSEELTVSNRSSSLTWIAGVFLFRESDREPSSTVIPELAAEFHLRPDVMATARAAFGQATITVAPRVALTGGLRYTHERKTILNSGGLYTADAPARLLSDGYGYSDRLSHDAWTPKVGIDLRARENVLAYASATRGFKSGGFNATSASAGRGYGPEWVWSYETGLKAVMRRGRTRTNVALFHTDYTDLQVQTPISTTVLDVANAAEATIRGVELEATTLLGAAIRAGGHLVWLDATYDRYRAVGPGGALVDVAGRFLNNAPQWSGRAWIDWTRPVARGSLSVTIDSIWKSTAFFTPFNDAIQRQPPMGLLDLSAEFAPSRRQWSVTAYARNLTNEHYITGSNSAPLPAIGGRPGDPRRVGVQVALYR